MGCFLENQQHQTAAFIHAEMVRQADIEIMGKDEAAARLAAFNRFSVPQVRT